MNDWNKIRKYFSKLKRDKNSHKGMNGKVLVIGGSCDLVGAPALAAMSALACLRSGVDLVYVASPEKCGFVINTYSPDLIVKKIRGDKWTKNHLGQLLELAWKTDVVLIGNGMGREKETLLLIKKFVQKFRGKMVLDADALRACRKMRFSRDVLATPHAAEFEAFCGKTVESKTQKEKISIVMQAAREQNCTILLKGKNDIISDGKTVFVNKTGHSAMTVGGTGDILAGICAGFMALGAGSIHAARAGAYINGRIGEELYKKTGFSQIASDYIPEIPKFVKKLLS